MTPLFDYKNNFQEFENVKSILQYGDFSTCVSPYISIIMPIYQSPQFFKDALLSVVNQDCDFSYEIIVIDNTPFDGGKSDALLLIESMSLSNLYYYRNEINIGMCGNWNRGIELSRADHITICHDDDMLAPTCLSTLWKIHERFPSRAIFPSHNDIDESVHYPIEMHEGGKQTKIKCFKYDNFDMLMECPSNGVGCLFNRNVLLNLGGYNNEYYPALDYALYIKYHYKQKSIFCCKTLYYYRISESNTSLKIYDQYLPIMLFLWKSMIKRMKAPQIFGKHFVKTLTKGIMIAIDKAWRKCKPSVELDFSDRLTYFILYKLRILKSFSL